jgi:2-methylcitrate dehydratase PrpD
MTREASSRSVAQVLAARACALSAQDIPAAVRERCRDLLVDVAGLCVAARHRDYVSAVKKSLDAGGPCSALGHAQSYSPEDAALLNGTAAHGEDFDDTFEGGPVHSGAVVVPAVLAACERFGRSGHDALLGIATGGDPSCLSPSRPSASNAGFHPTAVLGAIAAALAVAKALGSSERQAVDALGIAGSMAAGIIEYLAEGAWTKRLHAGWAAHSGLHAARLAREGFTGPRTVLEGSHGLFFAFARDSAGDFDALTVGFGERWHVKDLAFKPYATGTMNQPYIDCALRLAKRGFAAEDVSEVLCETADGYVHRLWEPLRNRRQNDTRRSSAPFNVAWRSSPAGPGSRSQRAHRARCAHPRARRRCALPGINVALPRRLYRSVR